MSTGPGNERTPLDEPADGDELGWKEEGLFVRDLDGRLIRYDAPTREELEKKVKLKIDGAEIEVMKAVPATDEMGNPRYDDRGRVIPRATTIYDAVSQLYEKRAKDERSESRKAAADGSVVSHASDDGE